MIILDIDYEPCTTDTGAARKHEGTGLGHIICRDLIDAHGGKIWFDRADKIHK
jgi:signal transduction histidine kinase